MIVKKQAILTLRDWKGHQTSALKLKVEQLVPHNNAIHVF